MINLQKELRIYILIWNIGTYNIFESEDGGNTLLQNVCDFLPYYVASHPIRQ
jgi:hypothetical protein